MGSFVEVDENSLERYTKKTCFFTYYKQYLSLQIVFSFILPSICLHLNKIVNDILFAISIKKMTWEIIVTENTVNSFVTAEHGPYEI